MRDPLFPGVDATATFYQGVNKSDGANQTGGTFYYRIDGGSWQSMSSLSMLTLAASSSGKPMS